jgi:hypothetical protein
MVPTLVPILPIYDAYIEKNDKISCLDYTISETSILGHTLI